MSLYWCSTRTGDSDYWVIADSRLEAREYFSTTNGYELYEVFAKLIAKAPKGTSCLCPVSPTKEELLHEWRVQYNSHFHIFYRGKTIFRPEGITRALMISNARAALIRRMRGRNQKNAC